MDPHESARGRFETPPQERTHPSGIPHDAGPALHEHRFRLPHAHWFIPPGLLVVFDGFSFVSAQGPMQMLGPVLFGAVPPLLGTVLERSYRWRVTSRHLVHGRLRWPFLRGGGSLALDRITAVETITARNGRALKRAVDLGAHDVGRVRAWMRGAVIVYVDSGQPGAHRLVIGAYTTAAAEQLAMVLRAASGAPPDPPQPAPAAGSEQRAPDSWHAAHAVRAVAAAQRPAAGRRHAQP